MAEPASTDRATADRSQNHAGLRVRRTLRSGPHLAPFLARASKHNTPTKSSALGFRCLNSESFAPEPLFVHGFAHQRADGRRMRTAPHADQADLAPELWFNDRQRHHARVPGGIRR